MPGFRAKRRTEGWLRSKDVLGWKRDRESCWHRTWGNKKPLYEKTFTKRCPRPVQTSSNKEYRHNYEPTYPRRVTYPSVRSLQAIASSRLRKNDRTTEVHDPFLLPACLHVSILRRERFKNKADEGILL